jgi:LmbE family N-acetylglucosaminyl deacetylase
MQLVTLAGGESSALRVLALGAHADDIEIGCGATLLSLVQRGPVSVTWVVLGADGVREDEARASAALFLAGAGESSVVCHRFRDGYFPYDGGAIKDVFEDLKRTVEPDVIFTHTRYDLHQDHRLVCELTWNTWRDNLVLEYEIPKYDGDLGNPNVYVEVSEELAREKTRMLEEVFASQRGKHWFDEDLFLGLMRVRGVEGAARSGYAEAFFGRKIALDLGEPS